MFSRDRYCNTPYVKMSKYGKKVQVWFLVLGSTKSKLQAVVVTMSHRLSSWKGTSDG